MARRVGKTRTKQWLCAACALIGIALAPANALAVTPPTADAPNDRIAFETSWYLYAAPHHQPQQFAALGRSGFTTSQPNRFRNVKLRLLHYQTPLRFGANDLIFKFRAPGKKRTIASIEFVF